MTYKDKEKQREAGKERQRRYRENTKALRDIPDSERRGKQITKFAHLPIDVQRTINRLSDTVEEKSRRTAIAINYQHLFPDRYYNTGIALSAHKYKDKVYAKEAVIYNEGVKAAFE